MRAFIFWLLMIGPIWLTQAQTAPHPEASVKAVFIYNFTQFVSWPPDAFPEPDSPFTIGILGTDPFGAYMNETVSGEKVGNHPIRVQRYREVTEIKDCHLLYIGVKEGEKAKEMLAALGRRPILTVGEEPMFAKQGGMIRFFYRKQ